MCYAPLRRGFFVVNYVGHHRHRITILFHTINHFVCNNTSVINERLIRMLVHVQKQFLLVDPAVGFFVLVP